MKAFFGLIVVSLALFLSSSAMAADTFKDEAAIKKMTDAFMKKIGSGDLTEAYAVMRPYVNMNDVEYESGVNKSNEERQTYSMQYGPLKGYAFVREKKVGDILYGLLYIEQTEKQAVLWYFNFFKTGDEWKLDEFYWNDRLGEAVWAN